MYLAHASGKSKNLETKNNRTGATVDGTEIQLTSSYSKNLIIYMGFIHPRWWLQDFFPSTVTPFDPMYTTPFWQQVGDFPWGDNGDSYFRDASKLLTLPKMDFWDASPPKIFLAGTWKSPRFFFGKSSEPNLHFWGASDEFSRVYSKWSQQQTQVIHITSNLHFRLLLLLGLPEGVLSWQGSHLILVAAKALFVVEILPKPPKQLGCIVLW